MSANARQFCAFAAAILAWSAICRLLLELDFAHPVAVGSVWLIGFVWITGYIIQGTDGGDLLTKRWLQMLAGIGILSGVVLLAIT